MHFEVTEPVMFERRKVWPAHFPVFPTRIHLRTNAVHFWAALTAEVFMVWSKQYEVTDRMKMSLLTDPKMSESILSLSYFFHQPDKRVAFPPNEYTFKSQS